jgi:hypothetical protein
MVAPISATSAQESAGVGVVTAVSQGWWAQTGPLPTVPPNPLTALAPAAAAPAPDVADGVLPVAMRLGQVARVAAIGISMDAPAGSQVDRLVLHLKESGAHLAQQGSGPALRACPITDFLVPEENGDAANTPAQNCDIAHADGVRSDDGTWAFDLTAIGQAWASGAVSVNGIRIDPVGTAPATFQVGFTGYQDATFDASIKAGAAGNDAFGSSGSFGSESAYTSGSFDASTGSYADAPAAPAPAAAAPPSASPRRSAVPVVATKAAPGFTGSWLAVLLLIVGLGALGLAVAWSMGAGAAAVDPGSRRQGRVSRVLGRQVGAGGVHA